MDLVSEGIQVMEVEVVMEDEVEEVEKVEDEVKNKVVEMEGKEVAVVGLYTEVGVEETEKVGVVEDCKEVVMEVWAGTEVEAADVHTEVEMERVEDEEKSKVVEAEVMVVKEVEV